MSFVWAMPVKFPGVAIYSVGVMFLRAANYVQLKTGRCWLCWQAPRNPSLPSHAGGAYRLPPPPQRAGLSAGAHLSERRVYEVTVEPQLELSAGADRPSTTCWLIQLAGAALIAATL